MFLYSLLQLYVFHQVGAWTEDSVSHLATVYADMVGVDLSVEMVLHIHYEFKAVYYGLYLYCVQLHSCSCVSTWVFAWGLHCTQQLYLSPTLRRCSVWSRLILLLHDFIAFQFLTGFCACVSIQLYNRLLWRCIIILLSVSVAQCFPPDGCLNGGHCASPGICHCRSGWTGRKCEKRRCIPLNTRWRSVYFVLCG